MKKKSLFFFLPKIINFNNVKYNITLFYNNLKYNITLPYKYNLTLFYNIFLYFITFRLCYTLNTILLSSPVILQLAFAMSMNIILKL